MHCVQVVRDDFDAVLKAMFRPRGEATHIDIADGSDGIFITTEISELNSRWPQALSGIV
jgi:hypothetical protein